jgi:hypothetical protein
MPEAFGLLHTLVVILPIQQSVRLSFLTSGLEIEPCPALYEKWSHNNIGSIGLWVQQFKPS